MDLAQEEEKWKLSFQELELNHEEVLKRNEELILQNKTLNSNVQNLNAQISSQEEEISKLRAQIPSKTNDLDINKIASINLELEKKVHELQKLFDEERSKTARLIEELKSVQSSNPTSSNNYLSEDLKRQLSEAKQIKEQLEVENSNLRVKVLGFQQLAQKDSQNSIISPGLLSICHFLQLPSERVILESQEIEIRDMYSKSPVEMIQNSVYLILKEFSQKAASGSTPNEIGDAHLNSKIGKLVGFYLIESLVWLFKDGFQSPYWFTPATLNDLLIDLNSYISSNNTQWTVQQIETAKHFQQAVREIKTITHPFLYVNFAEENKNDVKLDIQFKSFFLHLLHHKTLAEVLQLIFEKMTAPVLSKYYAKKPNASILNQYHQTKIVYTVALISHLDFKIPLTFIATQ